MSRQYKARNPLFGVRTVKRRKRKDILRKRFFASIAPETKAYLESMRDTIYPGRLIDDAIKLYREQNEQPN